MRLGKYLAVGILGLGSAFLLTGCGDVKLAEYKGIEATKVICEIGDDEVEAAVEELMYDYVTYDDVTDRGAIEGDSATITYTTTLDGAEREEYSGQDEEIVIGEGYVFEDLEKAIIGMKTGEKKSVSVKVDENLAEDEDIGKTANVDVILNNLSVENTPEYTDEFVKENLGYNSKSEYEEQLKKDLLAKKEDEFKSEAAMDLLQNVVDNSTFKHYSQQLYKQCEEDYDANNEYMAAMYQMELADYEEMMGIDEDSKKEEIEAMIHEQQVIDAIAKKEKLKVSEDDIQTFADENYEDYECESAAEFIDEYGKEDISDYLLYIKVTDFLYDNAKLTEMTEEEYYARMQEEYESEEYDEEGEELELDDAFEDSDAIMIDDSDDTENTENWTVEVMEPDTEESGNEDDGEE